MASRLKLPFRPPPDSFPSWGEFGAIALLVLWLVAVVAVDQMWVHLLPLLAFGLLAFSFWNSRSPRGDS
jgi:hypothetical protein